MQQNPQYAMAIVAKSGKPDLFLTYIFNPKTREITENLKLANLNTTLTL